jgi:alpha-beta hydrolase superfamily lysophospholipase
LKIGTAIRLVEAGFAVYGIDYEGHGKSSGLAGLVNSFDDVADDCFNHFRTICGQILFSVSLNIILKYKIMYIIKFNIYVDFKSFNAK